MKKLIEAANKNKVKNQTVWRPSNEVLAQQRGNLNTIFYEQRKKFGGEIPTSKVKLKEFLEGRAERAEKKVIKRQTGNVL